MLTEYRGKVFNAEFSGDGVSIWKYVPVDDFSKVTTSRGLTFYEKVVDKNDVGVFFSVIFIAIRDNKKFTVKSFVDGRIEVICDDQEYAEMHGFFEVEHGVWCMRSTMDCYEKYQLIKCVENSDEKVIKELDSKAFIEAWNIYVKEVGI